MSIQANRTNIQIRPDPTRVFLRDFDISDRERIQRIIGRVTTLSRSEAEREADIMMESF